MIEQKNITVRSNNYMQSIDSAITPLCNLFIKANRCGAPKATIQHPKSDKTFSVGGHFQLGWD